ncbi:MAG: hypothetical protein J0I81_08565, partial [Hyphomicrobium sp.]|nr:hypothetical protein [Hyphomicrobium sp.]
VEKAILVVQALQHRGGRVERCRRDSIPAPNAEIADHGFFALDALPDLVSPGTLRRLQEIFGKSEPSSSW